MKKLLGMMAILLVFLLAACGSEDSETNTTSTDTNETEEQNKEAEEEPEEMSSEENESTEAKVGDTITSEAGEMTLVSRTDDVGTFETGSIIMTVEKVNGVSGVLSPEMVEYLEQEELEYIQVDMIVENTSEENITFYASQATMTTNTGEQLEPDMFLSDHIDGEFIGQVNKSGSSFYILENSKAEDVESVRLIYSAPTNDDFETVGEEVDFEVELKK
ncbi:hypothetical protein [Paraliobacillus sediminis]|uniref:hypothetical protein n=1 Tax=Paraliobacillus sediminis TaxID=1885916 RepID=UPI000E3BFD0B|nr:hypothetical protein [Paraliobacillus sediminis]